MKSSRGRGMGRVSLVSVAWIAEGGAPRAVEMGVPRDAIAPGVEVGGAVGGGEGECYLADEPKIEWCEAAGGEGFGEAAINVAFAGEAAVFHAVGVGLGAAGNPGAAVVVGAFGHGGDAGAAEEKGEGDDAVFGMGKIGGGGCGVGEGVEQGFAPADDGTVGEAGVKGGEACFGQGNPVFGFAPEALHGGEDDIEFGGAREGVGVAEINVGLGAVVGVGEGDASGGGGLEAEEARGERAGAGVGSGEKGEAGFGEAEGFELAEIGGGGTVVHDDNIDAFAMGRGVQGGE